jgi:hypothetical protein
MSLQRSPHQSRPARRLFLFATYNNPVHSLKGNLMTRTFVVVMFFLFSVSVSQAQSANPMLMSDAAYKTFLSQMEAALPKWETALKSINVEKMPQLSYSMGKSIADSKTLGLTEIGNIRTFIHFQRQKHTVSGELALKGSLDSLRDAGQGILWKEAVSGQNFSPLEKYDLQITSFSAGIWIDAIARVELLEKGACP